jgi:copper(I)-binding protein
MSGFSKIALGAALASLLAVAPALAGSIEVDEVRAVVEMENGESAAALFMTITNNGNRSDRLYAAKSKVARTAELRAEGHEDDRVLAAGDGGHRHATAVAFEVKPGERLELRDGGQHVMLHDLRSDLQVGDVVAVTLFFEEAGPVKITANVEAH